MSKIWKRVPTHLHRYRWKRASHIKTLYRILWEIEEAERKNTKYWQQFSPLLVFSQQSATLQISCALQKFQYLMCFFFLGVSMNSSTDGMKKHTWRLWQETALCAEFDHQQNHLLQIFSLYSWTQNYSKHLKISHQLYRKINWQPKKLPGFCECERKISTHESHHTCP